MRRIVIIGTGGMGREVLWMLRDHNAQQKTPMYDILGFVTHAAAEHGTSVCGMPVLGAEDYLTSDREAWAVCAIGNPRDRRRVTRTLEEQGVRFETVIHPSVLRSEYVEIGPGSMVCAHATLTTQVRIGAHVIVNIHASVSHDATLEDYATLAPGVRVPGHVTVGCGADLGTQCTVLPGRRVGRGAVVGAGAVVTQDVEPYTVVAGVPARLLRRLDDGRPFDDARMV